jgi:glycerol-3-phosphate dehydrogenase (NAD(P)+)
MSRRVVIAGDGQMGLVMAGAALEAGADEVVVWGPFEDSVAALQATRRSPRLPDWQIPESVEFAADPAVFAGADLAVNAIPTQFVRPVWTRLAPHVAVTTPIVSTAKGLETGTGRRPTEILAELVAGAAVAVLSGPTIAAELARRQPALMVAASADHEVAVQVRETFGTPWLRIYESDDPLGVELAGALKNVIALAAGLCDGMGLGFNAKSALLARGLAEMVRFAVAAGASPATFYGIAGVGDLATTCFSPEGRNRSCGEAIARGATLDAYIAEQACVVEGVPTVTSVLERAATMKIEMPITAAVGRVLFEGVDPATAIRELMTRPTGPEGVVTTA